MALGAPWRDHRFSRLDDRRAFEGTHGPGAVHGAMWSAGLGTKEKNASFLPMRAARVAARSSSFSGSGPARASTYSEGFEREAPATPPAAWRRTLPAYAGDTRFLPGRGPRPQMTGLEHRRRTTMDFCPSRGAGGGHHCCQLRDMRPAGVCTVAPASESPWAGHEAHSGAASCPDLRPFTAA
mmetsp:Transcript_115196/g.358745  ORF Transcript_115196/g.358745 Transcript_115196/m.358745 type:complete len:182 (+) Transcript_115196:52-597(+)